MREIKSEELKSVEFNLLKKIDRICHDNGWKYSLCGGTLLGAIRHKGFIPWDDDIDIAMPRTDYIAFLKYIQKHGETDKIRIVAPKISEDYAYLFAKVCDVDTVMEEENFKRDNLEMGVYVDVFPIDGLGDSEDAKRNFEATRFDRELLVARNWKRFFRSKTHAWYIEPIRFAFWVISRFVSTNRLVDRVEEYYAQFPIEKSECAAIICGSYREKEIMPTEILNSFTEVEFEGKRFMAFKEYDKYLRKIYGDYMKLPPKEKQITHHMFKAYWKD